MNLYFIISRFFEWETRIVTKCPLFFIAVPAFLTICITIAAFYDLKLNETKQSLEMFLPDQMESLVHGKVFTDICFKDNKEEISFACSQHPILLALEDTNALLTIQLLARYPTLQINNVTVDNSVIFGGVTVSNRTNDRHGNNPILRARAIRLIYVLSPAGESNEWITRFLRAMHKMKSKFEGATLHYTSSNSLPEEMERNGELLVPWMPYMVLILIIFCALICSVLGDPIASQPLLGLAAMLNACMAVCGAISTLVYLQYPYLHMILIMPFLILSIGVDNMFLMLKCWRIRIADSGHSPKSDAQSDSVLISAITEVSAPIFVTSLTDGISFAIGVWSDFIAVRIFCTYCALAILYMFVLQSTFFVAIMTLHCRREVSSRHWLCCMKLEAFEPLKNDGDLIENVVCNSGSLTVKRKGYFDCLYTLLAHCYENKYVKGISLLIYTLYLFQSVNWIIQLPLGLDLKLLTPDGSYVAEELRTQEIMFSEYGAFCFCIIYTTNVSLNERSNRRKIISLYNNLTSGTLVSKGDFWLNAFEEYTNETTDTLPRKDFQKVLSEFLDHVEFSKYRSDIRFTPNGQIEAIKMIMRVRKLGSQNDEPRADFLRNHMSSSGLSGFVYDTSFLIVDQQSVTRHNVVINVLIAISVMFGISAILVPRPVSVVVIALSILSINVGVVGALSAAGTRLDIISMITIIMSIGFSVDYTTHIAIHFLTQRTNRVERTLRAVCFPILQAAISTVIGVAILGFVPSYMIRTFVLTVLFVVCIGLVHALYFLPVFLDFAVPYSEYIVPYHPKHSS
ncbi:patched family domain-containing protein [Ditylenchus destructor]|nr:patched family domain-containing protein [Ditylenchus destructor]